MAMTQPDPLPGESGPTLEPRRKSRPEPDLSGPTRSLAADSLTETSYEHGAWNPAIYLIERQAIELRRHRIRQGVRMSVSSPPNGRDWDDVAADLKGQPAELEVYARPATIPNERHAHRWSSAVSGFLRRMFHSRTSDAGGPRPPDDRT